MEEAPEILKATKYLKNSKSTAKAKEKIPPQEKEEDRIQRLFEERGEHACMSELSYWAYRRRALISDAKQIIMVSFKYFGDRDSSYDLMNLRNYIAGYGDYLARHENELRRLRGLPDLASESDGIWNIWRRNPS